jgi:peptide chain release factor subunit 3
VRKRAEAACSTLFSSGSNSCSGQTGQRIVALIETTEPVCVERFTDYPQLGRFTLRDEGKTIAIGKVTKLVDRADESLAEAAEGLAI